MCGELLFAWKIHNLQPIAWVPPPKPHIQIMALTVPPIVLIGTSP